jgi:hypothetical protein
VYGYKYDSLVFEDDETGLYIRTQEGHTMDVSDYEDQLFGRDSVFDLTNLTTPSDTSLQTREDSSAPFNETNPIVGDAPPWNISTADVNKNC